MVVSDGEGEETETLRKLGYNVMVNNGKKGRRRRGREVW
jgi:hypothetical protein